MRANTNIPILEWISLADPSQLTNSDRVNLQGAATAYAKKAGMTLGDDGTLSGTALQAETVRKWLNQERTNANGRFVDALKDSLDDDVGQAAGGPIYDQARQLWRLRQQTLGDPKGILAACHSLASATRRGVCAGRAAASRNGVAVRRRRLGAHERTKPTDMAKPSDSLL